MNSTGRFLTGSVLDRIVASQCERWGVSIPDTPRVARSIQPLGVESSAFLSSLNCKRGNAVIAEVKLGSPRLGDLRGRVNPERVATSYRAAGAACLSVVVEEAHFFGSYDLARRCRDASGLPLLAKDFLVSERQLDRAADAGASAVLLIARLLNREELSLWATAARQRGLVPLVELHDTAELERLVGQSWEVLGINQRDLASFDVSQDRALTLREKLPKGSIAVAESGIRSRRDIEVLAAGGFDAFLVGETLLLSQDPGAKLLELLGERG